MVYFQWISFLLASGLTLDLISVANSKRPANEPLETELRDLIEPRPDESREQFNQDTMKRLRKEVRGKNATTFNILNSGREPKKYFSAKPVPSQAVGEFDEVTTIIFIPDDSDSVVDKQADVTGTYYSSDGNHAKGNMMNSDLYGVGFSMERLFNELNENVVVFNVLTADCAWQLSVNADAPGLGDRALLLSLTKMEWRYNICNKMLKAPAAFFERSQSRQIFLLCRSPIFTSDETGQLGDLLSSMQSTYERAEVCVPTAHAVLESEASELRAEEGHILEYLWRLRAEGNGSGDVGLSAMALAVHRATDDVLMAATVEGSKYRGAVCFRGEPDLERLMSRSRREEVLRWAWLSWRAKVGPRMRAAYPRMADVMNRAAVRNGYNDAGDAWRSELEMPGLAGLAERLYAEMRPLYVMLHGIARYFLRKHYGENVVSERGPIPAHILGNMWAQNWETIVDIIMPESSAFDLDRRISQTGWNGVDMARKAEDFYVSLGLPPMTSAFWKRSIFSDKEEKAKVRCHGTAANMFLKDDYRMIYCVGDSMEDFYVIHHEMGHIQYYMAYEDQPAIFKDGTNSAFQESVGDAVMLGVLTPQHLQRLDLLSGLNATRIHMAAEGADKIAQRNRTPHERQESVTKWRSANRGANANRERDLQKGRWQAVQTNSKKYSISRNGHEQTASNSKHKVRPKMATIKTANVKGGGERTRSHLPPQKLTEPLPSPEDQLDNYLLLRHALTRLPHIPFALLMDKYRWEVFAGSISEVELNKRFWDLTIHYQGIAPPNNEKRGEEYFDVGAKFHVPDNTPYIRYFLSSFLQSQLFRGLCHATLYGPAPPKLIRAWENGHGNSKIPLHRCDIYGSKEAGKKLRDMMSKGSSITWSEALKIVTGETQVTSDALLEYFKPLQKYLHETIKKYDIHLGW